LLQAVRDSSEFAGVAVAWQQGSRSPAVAAFVRAAVEIAERNTVAFTVAAP